MRVHSRERDGQRYVPYRQPPTRDDGPRPFWTPEPSMVVRDLHRVRVIAGHWRSTTRARRRTLFRTVAHVAAVCIVQLILVLVERPSYMYLLTI